MYSACLFCRAHLGANETFESFPVGRRLAYDAARGRLWVVCPHCARWNLTPLEERWEAMDEAERRMERVRARVSSDEITLGRLPEGTELVRIGRPVPREMATWRYGDQFGRRRRRNLIVGGAVAAVGGAALAGGVLALGVGTFLAGSIVERMRGTITEGPEWMTVARLRAPDGSLLALRPKHLRATTFGHTRSGEPEVTIHFEYVSALMGRDAPVTFTGADAEWALRTLLPAANRVGGTREDVDIALARFTSATSPRQVVDRLARSRSNFTPIGADTGWSRHLVGEVLHKQGLYAM
ncbi:MAG TPA: hypothetical protein VFV33_25620, partial [Gemmatimonadaceae bacterium]|nr:hypothetical protein [Gemmatimonadaceae bacterium]